MKSMSFEQIVGACIAVIVAGMPAMIALLKIRELHIGINSQLTAFIAATKQQSEERLEATKQQAEERIIATKLESDNSLADVKKELEGVRHRNDQLLDQLAEAVKRLPITEKTPEPPHAEFHRRPGR